MWDLRQHVEEQFGREKILEEVGKASAGTAKDMTLSGAGDAHPAEFPSTPPPAMLLATPL